MKKKFVKYNSNIAGGLIGNTFKKPVNYPFQNTTTLIDLKDKGRDKFFLSKRVKVKKIGFLKEKDLEIILRWTEDPETRRHLEPPPELPKDWQNRKQVQTAIQKLKNYYNNYNNFGEPQDITTFTAVNAFGEIVGVLTIRWRKDPYVSLGQKTASFERWIVSPKLQGRGIGTVLLATSIEYAFSNKNYKEIRTWVMTDKPAGNFLRNFLLLRKFGFRIVPEAPHWREYTQERNLPEYRDRDALWFHIIPDWYYQQKKINKIKTCRIKI